MENLRYSNQKIYRNKGNKAVLQQINSTALTILDIGCGGGDNAKILLKPGRIIDGVTISTQEAKIAQNFLRNVFIHNLEEGLPLTNQKYDTVICSHVLEHIAYSEKLLLDIYSILKNENSELIVALPNLMHYNFRTNILFGKFDYTESGVMDYTHLRWFTFNSAIEYFIKNKFKVIKVVPDGKIPFYSISKYLPLAFQNIISTFLYKISKGLFAEQMIFVLRKED